MSDEYADGRYRYGTDALVADNRIGPNFGKPMIHRSCSQQISTLQSQLAAALARADADRAALRQGVRIISSTLEAVVPEPCACGDEEYCRDCLATSTLEQAYAALAAVAPGEDKGGGEGLAILLMGNGA